MITSLNSLDVAFLVIISISILLGIIKGFIRELFSLAFFFIAVILSFLFYQDVGTFFMKYFKNRDISNFTGFISIFCVVLIVGSIITYLIKKVLTAGPLKSVDRILGGVFGMVRGILISGIIILGLITFKINDKLVLTSKLSPYFISTLKVFYDILPKNVKESNYFIKKSKKENGRQKYN